VLGCNPETCPRRAFPDGNVYEAEICPSADARDQGLIEGLDEELNLGSYDSAIAAIDEDYPTG
jgi:hypothetical protein